MLVITRRRGESVDLALRQTGQVWATVKVLELLPNGIVRLGFEADDAIHIRRDNMKGSEDNGESETNFNR